MLNRFFKNNNPSFGLAIVGGLIGATIGASLWAFISVLANYQIGYMAIAVGFVTGLLVRFFGKGNDPLFGLVGASFALLGCLAGNFLTYSFFVSQASGYSFIEMMSPANLAVVLDVFKSEFGVIDCLFYGIAVYEGFKFSISEKREESAS